MSIELKSVDETDYNLKGLLEYKYNRGTAVLSKDLRIDVIATEDMKSDDNATLGFTFLRAGTYQSPDETFAADGKSVAIAVEKAAVEKIHSIYVVSTRTNNRAYNNGKITVSVTQP